MPEFQVSFAATKPVFTRPELLTHPHIPRQMAGVNPRTILGKAWWDGVRRLAYAENNYNCWACGENVPDKPLEAHEAYTFNYEDRIMTFVEVVALCSDCHAFIHSGRLWMEHLNGTCSKADLARVLCKRAAMLEKLGIEPFWFTRAMYLTVCMGVKPGEASRKCRARAPKMPFVPGKSWRLNIGNDIYNSRGKLI